MIHIEKDFKQNSYEWYKFRKDFITMSPPSRLMGKSTFQSEVSNIIGRRLRDEPDPPGYQSQEMTEADENEPIARLAYEMKTGHDVVEAGFIWSTKLTGLSPDGLIFSVNDPPIIVGAIEIMCPNTGNRIHHERMKITEPKKRWQIAYYFYVINTLKWLDFVSYDPRLPGHELFIKRVQRDEVKLDLDLIDQRIKEAEKIITEFSIPKS